MKKKNNKRRKVSIWKAIIFEIVNLMIIGAVLFYAQTQITANVQGKALSEQLENLSNTLNNAYRQTVEINELYNELQTSKVQSIAYYLDNTPAGGVSIDELCDVFDVQEISFNKVPDQDDGSYFKAERSNGSVVVIKIDTSEMDELLGNIYTQNKILRSAAQNEDLFLLVTTSTGNILYYPKHEFIDQDVSSLGIRMDDLKKENAHWLNLESDRYFLSSTAVEDLDLTVTVGVLKARMTENSYIVAGILFAVIAIIYSIIIFFIYFSKQEDQEGTAGYEKGTTLKKALVYIGTGLVLIGIVAYYVQTLFSLSLHGVESTNLKNEVVASLEEAVQAREGLQETYNKAYLNKAQSISYMLSTNPSLKTKKHLKKLSEINDLQYIMLFDKEGKETLSDSSIIGFELSDDPESQSYAFNVLKNGIPYVIQDIQADDLTKEVHQFIGVSLTNSRDEYDGFLQIAVSAEKQQDLLEETSLENTLVGTTSGNGEKLLVVDMETEEVLYSGIGDQKGKKAVDVGIDEYRLGSGYYGVIPMEGTRYYGNSFDYEGMYIYVLSNLTALYEGRLIMTLFAVLVSGLNFLWFLVYIRGSEVDKLQRNSDASYVDVTVSAGRRRTLDIQGRLLRMRTEWDDKTPEEKTGRIVRTVIAFLTVFLIVLMFGRGYFASDESILYFLFSGKWTKGFNVFSITTIFIYMAYYSLAMTIVNAIMDLLFKYSTPKIETSIRLVRSFIRYGGMIFLIFYSLVLLGLDAQTIVASAGLMTLIIGLGARDLITDVLAGLFIIFEKEFQVGDIIEVGGFKGRVVEIGLRTTKIMDVRNDVKSINNRNLTNIVNKTSRISYVDIHVRVPMSEDIDRVEAILDEGFEKMGTLDENIIEGPAYCGIDEITDKAMVLAIRTACSEDHKFEVKTKVNRAIKVIFEENGINT